MVDSTNAPAVLLDSWPVLEWLKGRQPAARAFSKLIDGAFANEGSFAMSRMNYGEVLYTIKKDFPKDRVDAALQAFLDIPIYFHSIDDLLVDEAAQLKSTNTISYADAFAAALAMRLNVPLVTGDREFLVLQSTGLRLLWVGK
jgi:predicted nucleic acid-binding protein